MCFVTCRVPWISVWTTGRVMESDLQGRQIQIRQGVYLIGKTLQCVALGSDHQFCRGSVESKSRLL